jgi:phosphoenolpyruvate synthase
VIGDVSEIGRVQAGDVLVTDMTDPNWEPVMKRASAIVTNRGGRTCHAAIIARELGVPAVVGCEDATEKLAEGAEVTVSCAEGDTGYIYAGKMDFEQVEIKLDHMPAIPVKIAMNVGNPQLAFDFCQLPNDGVGLARLEFIISNTIGIHPKACLEFASLAPDLKAQVARQSRGYANPVRFYVDKIAEGVATIAAAFWPKKVIVRMSDFKSNEYRNLIGGTKYEPTEENPMLGFRGASRYIALLPRLPSSRRRCARARRDGLTNGAHDPVRAHAEGGRAGARDPQGQWPRARQECTQGGDDVRDPVECDPRRRVPQALRRLLDRLQRHDPAHARARPRFGAGDGGLRRA